MNRGQYFDNIFAGQLDDKWRNPLSTKADYATQMLLAHEPIGVSRQQAVRNLTLQRGQ